MIRPITKLLAALLASGVALHAAGAARTGGGPFASEAAAKAPPSAAAAAPRHPKRAVARDGAAARRATRARWLAREWGIDVVDVHPVSSGYMLRFDYRVLDPERAATLADHAVRPYLIDEATRTALAVPAMENVGELRQVAPLEPHRTYFIIFGNPGRLVKRGSRVTLVAGELRATGLVVN